MKRQESIKFTKVDQFIRCEEDQLRVLTKILNAKFSDGCLLSVL